MAATITASLVAPVAQRSVALKRANGKQARVAFVSNGTVQKTSAM